MSDRSRALSSHYVSPAHRGGAVSRQTLLLTIVVATMVFAGKASEVLGSAEEVSKAVWGAVIGVGTLAGTVYHPIRRFWWRGALGGAIMTAGAFVAYRAYAHLRPGHYSVEFAVVVLVGALPGLVLYYLLMRGQRVQSTDAVQ